MSQIAYPTSLITADWIGAYASLSDGSDGTYILSPTTTDEAKTFVCALQPLTDPGVDTGHEIRVRAMIDTLGAESLMLMVRVENVDDGSVVAAKKSGPIADSYANLVLSLSEAQAALIHDYAALRLSGWWWDGGQPFVWDAVVGATSYILQIGTATTLSDSYNKNVGNVTTYTVALAAGTYYVRVVPVGAGSTTAEQTVVVT